MTSIRYRSYRRALACIERERSLNEREQAVLRDCAEGLLLARGSANEETEELREVAALALSMVVGQRRLSNDLADRIWRDLDAAGPRRAGLRIPAEVA